jgi:hypothetical protein
MLSAIIGLFVLATLFAVPLCAGNIFDDQFGSSVLPPEWTTDPGSGAYSLTDNPGYLRYTIDAFHTGRWGTGGYDKSLWLVRPFSGNRWILKAAITFDMRPSYPTNNRNAYFGVETPGYQSLAYFFRSAGACDDNPNSNLFALAPGVTYSQTVLPGTNPCIYPLPIERWYIEVERDGDHVTIRASNDGNDSNFEYTAEDTAPLGTYGNDQEIIIEGDGWYGDNDPPGYFEFDFITVSELAPISVEATTWGKIKALYQ